LYLPKAWTDDRERCRAAGIGDQVGFQTKPQLAQAMLQRAVETRVPFGWVTGDTVYGGDRRLRVWLEQHGIPHVLAVKRTEPLLTMTDRGPGQVPAEQLLAQVEPEQWLRLSAGEGSKGRRLYDWVRVPLWRWGWPGNVGFWLLARRSISDPTDLAFYACFAPAATSLATLVQVAGCRWRVEMVFSQLAKGWMRAVGCGGQHVADLNLAVGDDHAVDEQLDQQPPLGEGGGGQPCPDGLAERLDAVGHGVQLQPLLGDGVQLALLGQQGGAAAVQLLPLAPEFGQRDHLGQVGVQQPLPLALQLAQGLADDRLPGPGAPAAATPHPAPAPAHGRPGRDRKAARTGRPRPARRTAQQGRSRPCSAAPVPPAARRCAPGTG
jgi:DDE superfamily endonuclease